MGMSGLSLEDGAESLESSEDGKADREVVEPAGISVLERYEGFEDGSTGFGALLSGLAPLGGCLTLATMWSRRRLEHTKGHLNS